jgi:hypothetical protein
MLFFVDLAVLLATAVMQAPAFVFLKNVQHLPLGSKLPNISCRFMGDSVHTYFLS